MSDLDNPKFLNKMLNHLCVLFVAVLRNIKCKTDYLIDWIDAPPDELYEPLSYAGLARVDLLHPTGINFSVTGI